MAGGGAAAAADDAGAGIAGEAGIVGHDRRRAVIDRLQVGAQAGHAAIALGDDHGAGLSRPGQAQDRIQELGRADAAIGAERQRPPAAPPDDADRGLGRDAHHGPAGAVEGHGHDIRQARCFGAADRRRQLVLGEHGLDPGDIDAARLERCRLFRECRLGVRRLAGAKRRQDLAGRPHRARDDHRPARPRRDRAGDLGGGAIDLGDPVAGIVEVEAVAVAAEAVGQDDVGAGLDEAAMDRGHPLRLVEIPQLARRAIGEAEREQAGAHAAIGQQHVLARQQFGQAIGGHGSSKCGALADGRQGPLAALWATPGPIGNRPDLCLNRRPSRAGQGCWPNPSIPVADMAELIVSETSRWR